MTKELEKETGCKVVHKIKADDTFTKLFAKSLGNSVKHVYVELVNKKGKVVQIITDPIIAISAAGRMGLDYRVVEFEEVWEEEETE